MAGRFQFKISTVLAATALVAVGIAIQDEGRAPLSWQSVASTLLARAVAIGLVFWVVRTAKP